MRKYIRKEKIFPFLKAQVSAFVGGAVDYSLMIFFTEVFHIHYTISICIGGIIGAIVNFSINNKWSFKTQNEFYKNSVRTQLFKFVLVVANSILLKSYGTYLLSTHFNIDYRISRITIDLIVSLLFNYSLQKYWVFKKAE